MGDSPADILGAIVNAGKTAWDIIKDGKATSSASSSYCSAVPDKVQFTDLSGWKTKSGGWKYKTENLLGVDVIEAEFKYSFKYAGVTEKYKDALFVTNFCVWSPNCSVSWGWGFDANASVQGSPYNAGSKTKIIGAVPILVRMASSGMNTKSITMELTAHGDGKLTSA